MNERIASKYILTQLRKEKVHCQRIESVIDQGIPDINCCAFGMEFWIEMKSVKANKINLRAVQMAWHAKRARAGGMVLIIAYHNNDDTFSLSTIQNDYKTLKEICREPKKEFGGKLIAFIKYLTTLE